MAVETQPNYITPPGTPHEAYKTGLNVYTDGIQHLQDLVAKQFVNNVDPEKNKKLSATAMKLAPMIKRDRTILLDLARAIPHEELAQVVLNSDLNKLQEESTRVIHRQSDVARTPTTIDDCSHFFQFTPFSDSTEPSDQPSIEPTHTDKHPDDDVDTKPLGGKLISLGIRHEELPETTDGTEKSFDVTINIDDRSITIDGKTRSYKKSTASFPLFLIFAANPRRLIPKSMILKTAQDNGSVAYHANQAISMLENSISRFIDKVNNNRSDVTKTRIIERDHTTGRPYLNARQVTFVDNAGNSFTFDKSLEPPLPLDAPGIQKNPELAKSSETKPQEAYPQVVSPETRQSSLTITLNGKKMDILLNGVEVTHLDSKTVREVLLLYARNTGCAIPDRVVENLIKKVHPASNFVDIIAQLKTSFTYALEKMKKDPKNGWEEILKPIYFDNDYRRHHYLNASVTIRDPKNVSAQSINGNSSQTVTEVHVEKGNPNNGIELDIQPAESQSNVPVIQPRDNSTSNQVVTSPEKDTVPQLSNVPERNDVKMLDPFKVEVIDAVSPAHKISIRSETPDEVKPFPELTAHEAHQLTQLIIHMGMWEIQTTGGKPVKFTPSIDIKILNQRFAETIDTLPNNTKHVDFTSIVKKIAPSLSGSEIVLRNMNANVSEIVEFFGELQDITHGNTEEFLMHVATAEDEYKSAMVKHEKVNLDRTWKIPSREKTEPQLPLTADVFSGNSFATKLIVINGQKIPAERFQQLFQELPNIATFLGNSLKQIALMIPELQVQNPPLSGKERTTQTQVVQRKGVADIVSYANNANQNKRMKEIVTTKDILLAKVYSIKPDWRRNPEMWGSVDWLIDKMLAAVRTPNNTN